MCAELYKTFSYLQLRNLSLNLFSSCVVVIYRSVELVRSCAVCKVINMSLEITSIMTISLQGYCARFDSEDEPSGIKIVRTQENHLESSYSGVQ